MICPFCKERINNGANFCRNCGAKITTVCNCWVKKEPYNCGQGKCPGYRLFQIKRSDS